MRKKTGIYKIINKISKKFYVGSAVDIKTRWSVHKHQLINNTHHSKKLQNSVNKHGLENFFFEIIEECEKELLIQKEQYWMDFLNSVTDGYNVAPSAGNCLGKKHSEETKKKIGQKSKGRIHSEERNKKISEANKINFKGSKNPMYGKKLSEKHRKKISEKLKGDKHPMYGKKLSEKHRKKISEKLKGSKKGRNNPRYIPTPVLQYDINYNLIKEWPDLISIKENGVFNSKNVSKVCRGINKIYKKFLWEFKK
jgi:group I intron endonuclease